MEPSVLQSVITVCEETDKIIQRKLIACNGKLPREKHLVDRIALTVLSNLGDSNVFEELNEHALETPIDEEYHIFQIVKIIAKCYCKIRFHHLAKMENETITGTKIRNILNKLVLFKNQ